MTGRAGRSEDGIGRVLVASLHQAISDAMPQRLEYYEHWLGPMGLKDGRNGLAPLAAVLSFLRQEGRPRYDDVMTRAGQASAEWHLSEDAVGVRLARALPPAFRRRLALGRSRRLVRAAFRPAVARVDARRGHGHMELDGSVFCAMRDPWPWPTCTYFAAAVERHLVLCGASARVEIARCRATGAGRCRFDIDFTAAPSRLDEAQA
jgi:hypothetical protein